MRNSPKKLCRKLGIALLLIVCALTTATNPTQPQKLSDSFVAVDRTTAVVSKLGITGKMEAVVFTLIEGAWQVQQELISTAPDGGTRCHVAILGETNTLSSPGAIALFRRSGGIWTELFTNIESAAAITNPPPGFEKIDTPQPRVSTLATVTVNPTTLAGGATAVGTITLTGNAPAGGVVVSLGADEESVVLPDMVTVPSGKRVATFNITANPVARDTAVAIYGSCNGVIKSTKLTIKAAQLLPLRFKPTSCTGGAIVMGVVKLSSPAPVGGIRVAIKSDKEPIVPAEWVTILPGQLAAMFIIHTVPTTKNTVGTFQATYGIDTVSASLRIAAPVATIVSFKPSSVVGGEATTATVSISGPAPAEGFVVKLLNSAPAVAVIPPSVTIPAGQFRTTFSVTTSAVKATKKAKISATAGVTVSGRLTVTKP